jgi:hypothetical protein
LWLADLSAIAGDYEAAGRYGQRAVDVLREQGHLAFSGLVRREPRALAVRARTVRGGGASGLSSGEASRRRKQTGFGGRCRRACTRASASGEAERLGFEAIAIVEQTDMLSMRGNAYWDLAEVLAAAERGEESAWALERYETRRALLSLHRRRSRQAPPPVRHVGRELGRRRNEG